MAKPPEPAPSDPEPESRALWVAGPVAASLAGLLAGLVGLGVGHLVAGLVNPASSPAVAVGTALIDAAPTAVKEWVVGAVGTADKPLLVGGILLVTCVLCALLGVLARRRPGLAATGVAALGLIAAASAGRLPGAGLIEATPGLAAAAVAVPTLRGLSGAIRRPELDPVGRGGPVSAASSRRRFLRGAAAAGAGAAVTAVAGQRLISASTPAPAITLPRPGRPRSPLPAGLESVVPGVSALRTPVADFFRIDTALVVPRVEVGDWRLTIDGDVERPLTFSFDQLSALPTIEADITLVCVSNEVGGEYVGSARWLGVRTAQLLAQAGVRPGADQILSTSVDGMTISTPTQALTDGRDAMVAIAMNGAPLTAVHGYPARLVTPGLYGFIGATKWVTRLTATTYARDPAYWTKRGWAVQAPVLTQSRIETPRPSATVAPGPVVVGGVAWAPGRGVRRVELRADDGAWAAAELGPDIGIDYWRQWRATWTATPGRHTLTARATDGDGVTQTEQRADPFPRGATGWHRVTVTASAG